jgi:hypothetical protein
MQVRTAPQLLVSSTRQACAERRKSRTGRARSTSYMDLLMPQKRNTAAISA